MSGLNRSTSKSVGPSHFSLYLDVTFNFLNCICILKRTDNATVWPLEKSVSLAFPPPAAVRTAAAASASAACAGWAACCGRVTATRVTYPQVTLPLLTCMLVKESL